MEIDTKDGSEGVTGPSKDEPPTHIGLYSVERVIVCVNFVKVYLCRDEQLERIVAVKTPKMHMHTPEGREYFVNEARRAASLDHPQIVRIFSLNAEHEPPYYVMQFVAGQPLDEACRGKDDRQVASLLEGTARVLAFAHRNGVIHRDIKPGNILVPHPASFFRYSSGKTRRASL